MPNNYYTFTDTFVPGARARSGDIDRELLAIETAFDNLPASTDSLSRGTSTFAPETGTGNAYVVTMPDTRTSNQDGDEVIFFASHGNTGNVTLNVDGIGPVSMRDRTGAQIASGGITNGRLYVATYDATNAYFVLDAAINTITNILDQVQGSSTDDPTAPGTFDANLEYVNANSVVIGRVGYNSDIDYSIINQVYGGSVILQGTDAGGTIQNLITSDPDTDTKLFYAGSEKLATLATGISVTGDVGGTTIGGITQANLLDKTATETVSGAYTFSNVVSITDSTADPLTVNGTINGTYSIVIDNDSNGTANAARISITSGDLNTALFSAGSGRSSALVTGGPTGASAALRTLTAAPISIATTNTERARFTDTTQTFNYAATPRLITDATGKVLLRSDTSTDTEERRIVFEHQDGTDVGYLGWVSSNTLTLKNSIQGGDLNLDIEEVGGGNLTVLNYDPTTSELNLQAGSAIDLLFDSGDVGLRAQDNSFVRLYYNGIRAAESATVATGGWFVDNQLTGSGLERALTTSDCPLTLVYVKDANEAVTSSATLQDDNDFTGIPLTADKRYALEAFFIIGSTVADFDYNFVFTNTPQVGSRAFKAIDEGATGAEGSSGITTEDRITIDHGDGSHVQIFARIHANATTGGTFKVQWAQSVADAAATTLNEGSWLRLTQLD